MPYPKDMYIHSFSSLSYDRSKASSKASSPHSAIQSFLLKMRVSSPFLNPLNPELNPICYLLALLGAHHFLHVSRIRVKLLTFRLLMSYIYDISHLTVIQYSTIIGIFPVHTYGYELLV